MIPVSLKLSNFTSYGVNIPILDFTKFHMAAISGSNGAGKSSLLDAMTWCIWGTSRLGDSTDPLIRLGQNEMWVEFSFQLDGHIYTIKRIRTKKGNSGTTTLELFSGSTGPSATSSLRGDSVEPGPSGPSATSSGPSGSPSGQNLTEGTIKTTQEKIIDLLHLNYETFVNSAFLRQGHADEFTVKGPTDRKSILADILGLSHYDKLEEKAKEKVKDLQNRLKINEYQLLEVEAEIAAAEDQTDKQKKIQQQLQQTEKETLLLEETLKTLRSEKEALLVADEQRKKLEQAYYQQRVELSEIMERGKNRGERVATLKKQIENLANLEKQIALYQAFQKEKEELEKTKQKKLEVEKQTAEVKRSLDLKNQQKEHLNKELEGILTKLADLKKAGARCPTCGQEIDQEHKHQVREQLSKRVQELKSQLSQIDTAKEEETINKFAQQLKGLFFDQQRYREVSQKSQELDTLQKQKEDLIQKRATKEVEEQALLEDRKLYLNKKSQVDNLAEESKKLPEVSEKLAQVNQEVEEKEHQLSGKRSAEKEQRNLLGQITELISRGEQMKKRQKKLQEEKTNLQKEKQIFGELSLVFGKKGIQAMIIETAIPEIEDETNKLLDKLTEGGMKVRLETQKETRAGTTQETLEIIISDEMGERPYEAYSGGEQFRVNVALRLALSQLLTRRAGAKLQFLVIDEGFGTQDQEGRGKIIEVLDTIRDDFEKIVVITHLEELKEEFPVRVEVAKGPAGSTFKVIGV